MIRELVGIVLPLEKHPSNEPIQVVFNLILCVTFYDKRRFQVGLALLTSSSADAGYANPIKIAPRGLLQTNHQRSVEVYSVTSRILCSGVSDYTRCASLPATVFMRGDAAS